MGKFRVESKRVSKSPTRYVYEICCYEGNNLLNKSQVFINLEGDEWVMGFHRSYFIEELVYMESILRGICNGNNDKTTFLKLMEVSGDSIYYERREDNERGDWWINYCFLRENIPMFNLNGNLYLKDLQLFIKDYDKIMRKINDVSR